MIDFDSLPLEAKIILVIGLLVGFASLVLCFRYSVMLILMKYSPEYRDYIKRTIARKKVK